MFYSIIRPEKRKKRTIRLVFLV